MELMDNMKIEEIEWENMVNETIVCEDGTITISSLISKSVEVMVAKFLVEVVGVWALDKAFDAIYNWFIKRKEEGDLHIRIDEKFAVMCTSHELTCVKVEDIHVVSNTMGSTFFTYLPQRDMFYTVKNFKAYKVQDGKVVEIPYR